MNSFTRNAFIGLVLILVIALLGYFVWQERQQTAGSSPATNAAATSTSGISATIGTSTPTSTNPGYTITQIPTSAQAPNYETPLVFSDPTLSAQDETVIQGEFAQAQAGIKANPTDYSAWMNLATLRMEAGDYSAAAADWKYVTELYPTDPTAYANLGNLYASYLKENTTAVANYKEAIKLDPTHEVSFYQNLAQIYLSESDTNDAKAVLEQGISAQVAGYQNLQTALNSLQ